MYIGKRVLTGMGAMLGLLMAFSAGCATEYGISAHRLRDLEAGEYYAAFEEFQENEVPCVLVQGFGGRSVHLDLFDQSSGVKVRTQEVYIKDGTARWVYWKTLPPGEYRSVLRIDDDTVDEAIFTLKGKKRKASH